ncbi:MAG: cob(I)yrinic acid a,c-diamide adenosyltransferase [Abditibacteriaceae bacterium]
MSIVTKKGDNGTTRLIYGETVSKANEQVEAYGGIDELNAFLGQARAVCDHQPTKEILEQIQRDSFVIGTELATPVSKVHQLKQRVDENMTQFLDSHVAEIELMPGILDDWSLPGATVAGAAIDVARVVARRVERQITRWRNTEPDVNPEISRYMNRLSDLLWLLGRRYEILHGMTSALRKKKSRNVELV